MGVWTRAPAHTSLCPPQAVEAQIAALEDELHALRRLLRASRANAKADEARRRRETLREQGGGDHAA